MAPVPGRPEIDRTSRDRGVNARESHVGRGLSRRREAIVPGPFRGQMEPGFAGEPQRSAVVNSMALGTQPHHFGSMP